MGCCRGPADTDRYRGKAYKANPLHQRRECGTPPRPARSVGAGIGDHKMLRRRLRPRPALRDRSLAGYTPPSRAPPGLARDPAGGIRLSPGDWKESRERWHTRLAEWRK